MRSGIISGAQIVFPGTPIRMRLMHFLRDLGKDLIKHMHTDLGLMINLMEIKSPLKKMLRTIPGYHQKILEEIESGFCTDRNRMEVMAMRRIVENIVSMKSSGYGFLFSMRHLNFFMSCDDGMKILTELSGRLEYERSKKMAELIMKHPSKIAENPNIGDKAGTLRGINSFIFQKIRKVFKIPDHGNLSKDRYNPLTDDPIVHDQCRIVFGELEVYLNTDIDNHMFKATKLSLEGHSKRESVFFAQNPECTIPRTNNGMEVFFRKIRRNIRKRSGNGSTGNILTQGGEKLALFQNMGNEEYRKIFFGKVDMGSVFAKYRKSIQKERLTRKRTIEAVDEGTKMTINGSLRNDTYTEGMFNKSSGLYIN